MHNDSQATVFLVAGQHVSPKVFHYIVQGEIASASSFFKNADVQVVETEQGLLILARPR
jgi:hypothetical protein